MQKHTLAVIDRYGSDPAALLSRFNPATEDEWTRTNVAVHFGDAPALCTVAEGYGEGTARSWLSIQLSALQEYCGVREKMSPAQMHTLVCDIRREFGHLKLSQFMEFARRLRTGRYGRFYGSVDPMVICEALRKYEAERRNELDRLRQRQEAEERREQDQAAAALHAEYTARVAQIQAATGLTMAELFAWAATRGITDIQDAIARYRAEKSKPKKNAI